MGREGWGEDGHERWKGSRSGPGAGAGRGAGRPGSAAPLPPRNRTRRSPPPAPSLLGPSQSLGSTGSAAPFSAAAATRPEDPEDPGVPLELAGPFGRPHPRVPSARLGLPLPRSPGPAEPDAPAGPASGRAGALRSCQGPDVWSRSPPRRGRDAAVPEPPRAGCPPPLHPSPSGPRPPPRDTYGLLPPQTRPPGGGEGAAGRGRGRLRGGELAECTTTWPAEGRGPGAGLGGSALGLGVARTGSSERAHVSTQPGARPSSPQCTHSAPGQSLAPSAAARAPPLIL